MSKAFTRRKFVGSSAALGVASTVGLPAVSKAAIAGSNDRIRLGVIGTANRGTQVCRAFLEHDDLEVVAICDVDERHLAKMASDLNLKATHYADFRELLGHEGLDAVLVATPDHWHAIQTIMACRAGKDVYVEKPLSMTVHEGRRMVEVARETGRVVQVGTQRRSSPVWRQAIEVIRSGALGKITLCHAYRTSNMNPDGIGKRSKSTVPKQLDWDMWLGPRPLRDYQDNIAPYKFRWWKNYSSQMGNWGVHYLDIIRWALEENAPSSICTMGGKFAIDDDRTIPDTAQAVFEFESGALAMFGTYEAFSNPMLKSGDVELRGTHGTLYRSANGIHVVPETRGQFQRQNPPGKKIDIPVIASNHEDTVAHTGNFLDCIKSRKKPNADVEIGHLSTTMSLLANISLETKQRLEWNSNEESFSSPDNANSLLRYEYRPPWSLD